VPWIYTAAVWLKCMAAVQTLAGLSALTRLEWHPSGQDVRSSMLPCCQELACLRSTSLRDLTMTIHQVPEVRVKDSKLTAGLMQKVGQQARCSELRVGDDVRVRCTVGVPGSDSGAEGAAEEMGSQNTSCDLRSRS